MVTSIPEYKYLSEHKIGVLAMDCATVGVVCLWVARSERVELSECLEII